MKKADMKVYKDRLITLRARLRGDVSHLANAALNKNGDEASPNLSSMPIHMADLGSDAYEQEFTLSLMESEEETLGAIEVALQKVEDGTYGKCDGCGGVITKTRLNAIPHTPLCIKCATERDRKPR